MNYPRIFQRVFNEPALMMPSAHMMLQESLLRHMEAAPLEPLADVRKREHGANPGQKLYYTIYNQTAVLPLHGIIAKKIGSLESMCGGRDLNDFLTGLEAAINDPSVSNILLDVDSPGGSVTGVYEAGLKIRELDQQKPIYTYTETLAASAAYWLSSQCRGVIATPSSNLGSIGVYMARVNREENITLIKSGKFKAMGLLPLSDDEIDILQVDCDRIHLQFKEQVRMRRDVKDELMEGLTYSGQDAVENGLADFLVMDFDEALELLSDVSEV